MKTLVSLALIALLMAVLVPSAKANDNHESDLDKVARALGYVQVGVSAINLIKGLNESRHETSANTGSLIPTASVTNGPAVVVMRFEGQSGDIARDEVIRLMKAKGYTPLAAADSMGLAQLQQELQLENGQYGSGVDAQFRNARFLISGTVQMIGETQTQIGGQTISAEFSQKTVEVTINAYDVRTRQMGAPQTGRATITALTDFDFQALRQNGSSWANLSEMDFRQRVWADRSRKAIGQAVSNALANEPMAVSEQPVRQDVVLTLSTNGGGANQPEPVKTPSATVYTQPTVPGVTGQLSLLIASAPAFPINISSGRMLYENSKITFYRQDKVIGEYQIRHIDGQSVFAFTLSEVSFPVIGDPFKIN